MLSRPNIVMNQGRPAAGSERPPAIGGEKRSAARSTRLRRYVALSGSQSHSMRGASSIQRSRFRLHAGLGALPDPAPPSAPWPGPQRAVTTSMPVDHSPCGSMRILEREALLVDLRRAPSTMIAVARVNVPRS